MMDLCTGLVTFAIPLLALQLGASVIELGLIGTAGSVAYTLSCTVTGKLADRFNRQRLMGIAALWAATVFAILIYVESVWILFILAPLCWMTLALFWPALQATLAEGRNRTQLAKVLGTFNMVWTIGYMNGPLLGGMLYETNPRFPFGIAMAGMLGLGLILFIIRLDRSAPEEEEPEEADPVAEGVDTDRFRKTAWIAAFTGFFVMGILNNQFPKLASELLISPTTLGYLLAVPRLAQFLIFALATKSHFWQFKLYPLIIPQIATIIGMIITASASDPAAIGLGFATLGLLIGGSFTASQFYSFYKQERKGEGGALNEMIVGLGNVSGPLIGGILAQLIGLRAPYVLCCVVLSTAIVIEYRLMRRR